MFLPHPRVKVSIVGSLRDREVACSVSDRQGSNFESCVWRTVSSQLSHHPQEVPLAQFSLYVHKGGLKPDSFHLVQWLKPSAWKVEDHWFETTPASPSLKMSLILRGNLCDRELDSVFSLKPPRFEFRILCLEGSVISSI